jgi:hypothetical protein
MMMVVSDKHSDRLKQSTATRSYLLYIVRGVARTGSVYFAQGLQFLLGRFIWELVLLIG